MVISNVLNEDDIRNIVRDEISQIIPEYEVLSNSQLTSKEKNLCSEAEEGYRKGETLSFEEVYNKLLRK